MIARSTMAFIYSKLVPQIPSSLARYHIGPESNFFISGSYRPRTNSEASDDRSLKDEWQREVYEFAHKVAYGREVKTVCDFGCGSGYKLMQHLKAFRTVGIEIQPALDFLNATYPDREWMYSDFKTIPSFPVDLFISSDAIQELPNPDLLIEYIRKIGPRLVVLSTTDRLLMGRKFYGGPPRNPAHVREWTFREFRAYISYHFTIERHFISNHRQGTQCVLCRP